MKLRMFVFVLAPLLTTGQQSTQPAGEPGSVDGRVTNSQTGEPVPGASIHLYPQIMQGASNSPLTAATQADGGFHFENVPPGSYFVAAEQSSFSNSSPAVLIQVAGGQAVLNVALPLRPLATITGKVLDEDGRPVPQVQVTVYTAYDWRGRTQLRSGTSATTGKDGTYQLSKVAPGRHFLEADPSSDNSAPQTGTSETQNASYELVRTFYPESLSLEAASALDITPGQNAAETVIHLQRAATHRVQGKVEELQPDSAALNANVSLAPRGTLPLAGISRTVKAAKDGSFAVDHVVSGNYTLWVTLGAVPAPGQPSIGARSKLLARQNIDVSAEDVTGIVLSVSPAVSLTGKLVLDSAGAQNLGLVRVAFIPGGEALFGSYASASVNPDGSFSVANLDPGEYRTAVQGAPAGSYVASIQYNRQDVTKTGIDLSQGGGGEVDVLLRMGAGEVDGTVATNGIGRASGIAVLVPEQIPPDGSGSLMGQLAITGKFLIRNVPPGRYFAVVVQRLTGVWQNPIFLREVQSESAAVEVQENGRIQVQAPVLSDQDVQQTAARLGLSTD
jgi:hypothetical protein